MIPLARHAARRSALQQRVDGPILLLGNGDRIRNIPLNPLPFRQDSTFLYLTGCAIPGAAALLADGSYTLFLPEPDADDALWHGSVPSLADLGAQFGADEAVPAVALAARVQGKRCATIAVADEARNAAARQWCEAPLSFGDQHGTDALVDAIIALRRTKDADEIAELRAAAAITERAFAATLRATHPGGTEHGLWALFEAVLRIGGCTLGYDTILSQAGEILHNHRHEGALEPGRMVLLDGGGELTRSGYTVDITRTWPVSGAFAPRQAAAYDAVLAAQAAAIARCRAGVAYREVHDTSSRVLARFLVDEGLAHGDPDGLVEQGAHAVFFPHGVGHHLGLDVHDLENFGDRPSYPAGKTRPAQFGTRNLRLDLPLEAGWVVTIEPGFYVVPAILADPTLRDTFAGTIDFDAAADWIGFGGIRIEDDVHVTTGAPEVLTAVPKERAAITALVGSGPGPEELLCCP